jgi:hypothetical protein
VVKALCYRPEIAGSRLDEVNEFFNLPYLRLRTEATEFILVSLVLSILGYRSGGPGSIPGTPRKKNVVGLERGPLSLVSTTEELLDRKVAALV